MFRSITAKNFQSWKELEFDFDSGVTLIQGWNKDDNTAEGAGKSAVLNALCWCLYGRLPKETNIDDVISFGERSCSVEVELENGQTIVRTRGPNDLFWINPGTPHIYQRQSTSKDTQRIVESIVGMSFVTFCSTIYFSQNNPYRFITATEEEKAKILSEIQDLNIFDRARESANMVLKSIELERTQIIQSLDRNKIRLEGYEREKKALKDSLENFQKNKTKQIEIYKEQLRTQEAILAEVNKKIDSYPKTDLDEDKLLAKMKEAQKLLSAREKLTLEMNRKAEEREEKDEKLQHLKEGKCPTCKQSFVNGEMIEFLTKKREEISQWLNNQDLSVSTARLMANEAKLNKQYSEIRSYNKDLHQLELKRSQAESSILLIKQTLDNARSQNNDDDKEHFAFLGEEIESLKEGIEVEQGSLQLKDELMREYVVLKDGFKDIKKYVFQSLLDTLNANINHHLAQLFDQSIHAEFSNTGDEGELSKIRIKINLSGQDTSFGLLSGGQAKRVELATSLAINDIISNRSAKSLKLRIFDEPFQNLSEASMAKMVELLQKQEGCTILIEHNSVIKNIVNNVFDIEYSDGQSKRLHGRTLPEQEGSGPEVGTVRQSEGRT